MEGKKVKGKSKKKVRKAPSKNIVPAQRPSSANDAGQRKPEPETTTATTVTMRTSFSEDEVGNKRQSLKDELIEKFKNPKNNAKVAPAPLVQPLQVSAPKADIKIIVEKTKEDPLTPYWEVELAKGAEHLKQHEKEFRNFERNERKNYENRLKKPSLYYSSGADDVSLQTLATLHKGPIPPNISKALGLFNGVEKIFFQPKELHSDSVCFCQSKKVRFFVILNLKGHKMFKIIERPKCCCRLQFHVYSFSSDTKIARIKRKKNKFRDQMDVYSPENFIGSVVHTWNCYPTYHVKDVNGELLFTIGLRDKSCCCCCGKCTSIERKLFLVIDEEGNEHGAISGDWDDMTYRLYLEHHLYGISFTRDLDICKKLLLMTAAIMIYYHHMDGKIVKQVMHVAESEVKNLIEYQYMIARDPSITKTTTYTAASSNSETDTVRPLINLE